MASLFAAAAAPVLICVFYIYIRDKYEKEPIRLLLVGLGFGILITFPIIQAENAVTALMPIGGMLFDAFYQAFAVAAFVEEGLKFAVLYCLTWRNRNLNERFDGIVYAVFIALGFAGFENVLYVLNPELGGMATALSRAVFSVPGHGFFGVTMGYYFALAKFEPEKRAKYMALGFLVPFSIHGVYDFILLSGMPFVFFVFVPFVAFLWVSGFRKMKRHLLASPFKPTGTK
ncbi:MAG: PrsW family intramembrane metalloprotease [Clostridiales bacterium]|jgi:RsiW-degrading membrane proteinase PrsW (M82 family)|nr:PrsW family intramembrane metalloprotease [Clostridiales bacterium]